MAIGSNSKVAGIPVQISKSNNTLMIKSISKHKGKSERILENPHPWVNESKSLKRNQGCGELAQCLRAFVNALKH